MGQGTRVKHLIINIHIYIHIYIYILFIRMAQAHNF